jgi:hypothetical protein
MKKFLYPLLRFSPLIILLVILIYLGSVNSVSEVYIDLISTKISFVIEEETDNLISRISADSIQLRNSDLKLRPGKIFNLQNEKNIFSPIKQLHIFRNDQSKDSQIDIVKQNQMAVENLRVPVFTQVDIIKEANTIRIDLLTSSNMSENCKGKIDVDGIFLFSGNNIKSPELDQSLIGEHLSISTHPIYNSVKFEANDNYMITIMWLPPEEVKLSEMVKNLNVSNISFVKTDLSKRKYREESAILSGNIQIAGIGFFGKRFLLKEERLDKRDFLDVNDGDLYFISSVSLVEEGFKISISSEEATELEKGKRIILLRSIFPSMLDFIITEPSKNTLWTILIFVLTQLAVLRKTLSKYFKKDTSYK